MMQIATKNRIGLMGFGVLAAGGLVYLAIAYWPVTWTKDGALLRADLSKMELTEVKAKLGEMDVSKLSDAQQVELSGKLRNYMDGLDWEKRRELMGRMWMGEQSDAAMKTLRELMRAQMRQFAFEYIATPEEERPAKLDEMMDQMRNRRPPGAGTQPGAGSRPRGERGPGTTRPAPSPGDIANRISDGLKNTPSDERAAMRKVRDDMRGRFGTGRPGFGGGPRGG